MKEPLSPEIENLIDQSKAHVAQPKVLMAHAIEWVFNKTRESHPELTKEQIGKWFLELHGEEPRAPIVIDGDVMILLPISVASNGSWACHASSSQRSGINIASSAMKLVNMLRKNGLTGRRAYGNLKTVWIEAVVAVPDWHLESVNRQEAAPQPKPADRERSSKE